MFLQFVHKGVPLLDAVPAGRPFLFAAGLKKSGGDVIIIETGEVFVLLFALVSSR